MEMERSLWVERSEEQREVRCQSIEGRLSGCGGETKGIAARRAGRYLCARSGHPKPWKRVVLSWVSQL
jgi:hypothetical protein